MAEAMQCPSCFCGQPDGVLCTTCTAAFVTMLAAVPQLVDQLQVAISKQARVSAVNGKGGLARERSPLNWGAVAVRDALLVEVALWGDDVAAVRRHPQAGEIVSGFGRVVKDAYRAIDRMQDRQYLGTCLYEEDGATCHAELWAREGAHEVRCGQCEQVWSIADRRKKMMEKAEDVITTVKRASEYIGELGGFAVSQKTIRTWMDRGKLPVYEGETDERHLRMGDLMEILREKASRIAA